MKKMIALIVCLAFSWTYAFAENYPVPEGQTTPAAPEVRTPDRAPQLEGTRQYFPEGTQIRKDKKTGRYQYQLPDQKEWKFVDEYQRLSLEVYRINHYDDEKHPKRLTSQTHVIYDPATRLGQIIVTDITNIHITPTIIVIGAVTVVCVVAWMVLAGYVAGSGNRAMSH